MVGCATGALAFELSKTFASIVASDFCAQFVATGEKLQKGLELQCFHQNSSTGTHAMRAVGQTIAIPNSPAHSVVSLPAGVHADRIVFKQVLLSLLFLIVILSRRARVS